MSKQVQWNNSRQVAERIFITGKLVLETPAHFGNGDTEGLTDIPLLYDPLDGETPLLTGASIAGALRNYLRAYEKGFGWAENRQAVQKSWAEELFGHLDDTAKTDDGQIVKASVESWFFVDDALGCFPKNGSAFELRDGVAIDAGSRTVEEDERGGHKYDIELLAAGTSFDLSFELWLPEDKHELLPVLAAALHGLEQGEIGLGMRKNRGFGRCRVTGWQVARYPMDSVDGVISWLDHKQKSGQSGNEILALLDSSLPDGDNRQAFVLDAWFALQGTLLIRSDGLEDEPADMVHLHSWRDGKPAPVLSGTSLAGVMRGRALRIAKTVLGEKAGGKLVNQTFGQRGPDKIIQPTGSRVMIEETLIDGGSIDAVQNRVKIDRFTGGSYPQALFSQQPLWAQDKAKVQVRLTLRRLYNEEEQDFRARVGLLLLVLKDLWTEDLPLGGESSAGRGRLRGLEANLACDGWQWKLTGMDSPETVTLQGNHPTEQDGQDARTALEKYVEALNKWRPVPETAGVNSEVKA